MLLEMVGANDSAKRPLIGLCHSIPRHGPIRPMAHVECSSREQNLMHATRVGRSSPGGSPSFWLPIHTRRPDCPRPNRRRESAHLRHDTFSSFSDSSVLPGTRNMRLPTCWLCHLLCTSYRIQLMAADTSHPPTNPLMGAGHIVMKKRGRRGKWRTHEEIKGMAGENGAVRC